MSEDEIKKIIFAELKKIAPDTAPEKLQPDENIRQALDIDSFDSLQFLVALNDELKIDIPEEDYGKISSLNALVRYIMMKRKNIGS